MQQVSIKTLTEARRAPKPVHYPGAAAEHVYYEGLADPIHLHLIALAPHQVIPIDALSAGHVLYIWEGVVSAGATELLRRSSLKLEQGAAVHLIAGEVGAMIFCFTATGTPQSQTDASAYLLQADEVTCHQPDAWPQDEAESGSCQVSVALHTKQNDMAGKAWLREERFSGVDEATSISLAKKALSPPRSSEIIVIIEGTMLFGERLLGPGTAIALPAHAPYGFSPGEGGLHIIRYQA